MSRRRVQRCCAHQRRTCPSRTTVFDVAVSTLVLCGVDDQPRALRELRRVLRPGGQFLFIEHVRSGDPGQARSQDRMNGLNRFVVGCDCDRATLDSIQDAGFTVRRVEHTTMPKVPQVRQPGHRGQRQGTRIGCRRWMPSSAAETGHDRHDRKVPPRCVRDDRVPARWHPVQRLGQ